MTLCPIEAAANLMRHIAREPSPSARSFADVAGALLRVPLDHATRYPHDRIIDRADDVRRGRATSAEMLAWADEIDTIR